MLQKALKNVLIIAELSANHNQKFDIAVETIHAAKDAGADAIKIQTYTPDTITIDCDNEYFIIKQGTIWDGRTLYQLYKEAFTPWEWQPKLKKIAEDLGLFFFSSPFDKSAVDFLEKMDIPAYKIASFEITDIPLIEYVATTKKPIIISTGVATLSDIELAVNACRRMGNNKIALLKCTSSYPANVEDANLLTIPHLRDTFNLISGLSDHTIGDAVAIASVALGARIIEKHFILDRNIGGPDSSFSMEPHEWKKMVDSIRNVELALGKINYELTTKVLASREHTRSLFVVENVLAGEILTEDNIKSIRPGFGLQPKYYSNVLGKKFRKSIKKGTPLEWEMFE
jgi:pseudaminic acid synthase